MGKTPYKVKAIHAYSSEHDDDLNFAEGQIITVTAEEDDDWLNGEYKDESGQKQGIFPKNFVERYEPVTPPRPARPTQRQPTEPVPVSQPQAKAVAPQPVPEPEPEHEEEDDDDEEEEAGEQPVQQLALAPAPAAVQTTKPAPPPRDNVAPSSTQESRPIPPPTQPIQARAPSPPTPDKPSASSFKDRIAAFNRGGASAPQAPPKPGGLGGGSGSGSFIKKTYMAPPPVRNTFVPPVNQAPVARTYRRDEDPEFAKVPAPENEPEASKQAEEPEEDQPKPMSLKERMALLQQQQLEQQARHADAVSKKAKPKPPPKKAAAPPPPPRASTDEAGDAEMARGASQTDAPPTERPAVPIRVLSNESAQHVVSPDHENTTERLAPPVDETAERSASEAGLSENEEQPEERGETENVDEEDEEEEDMDPEVRRRMEIRERMAKMSGGMGMGAMFGAPAISGASARKPSRTKSAHSEDADLASSPPQAIPVMPGMGLPGMALPGMGVPRPKKAETEEETQVVKEDDEDEQPISQTRRPDEVPDIEDVKEQPSDDEEQPVRPARSVPPRQDSQHSTELPASPVAAPPVPSRSRPPAVPPVEARSGAEKDGAAASVVMDRAAPPVPTRGEERVVPQPPPQITSPPLPPTSPPMTTSEKRASRLPPPVPGAIDSGVGAPRGPPPPPSQPPRARQSMDVSRAPPPVPSAASPSADGDYDPYNYESNPLGVPTPTRGTTPRLETDTDPFPPPHAKASDAHDTSMASPQSPTVRAPPPPPPHAVAPMAVPPPVPPAATHDDYSEDEEEDESEDEGAVVAPNQPSGGHTEDLHHAGLPSLGPATRAPPPPPPGQAPLSPQSQQSATFEKPSSIPPRVVPPPPPQTIVQEPRRQAAPPRPAEPTPRKSYDGRKSLDVLGGASYGRRSVDVPRPSSDVGDSFIAALDVDLGHSSGWWTQRKGAPPALQGRTDVLIDFDESTTMQDVALVTKHVYVLFMDYSQTIITARYAEGSNEVDLQQRHEPPPARLRQDQLETAHGKIGTRLAATAKNKENHVIGDGSAMALIHETLRSVPEALAPVGTRAFGAVVYANIGNASTLQHDEIRPGDIVSFRNAKLQGHRGGLKQKYSLDMAEHVGVVVDWDGTKKKVRAWEQGRESKKVKIESFKLGDLRSGEVKIWRVMSKEWVGWGST